MNRRAAVVVGLVIIAFSAVGGGVPRAVAGTLSPSLAVAEGPVDVLVELDVDVKPADELVTEAQLARRRLAIAEATEAFLDEMGPTPGWEVVRTFETIPWLALRVGPAALGQLEHSTLVRRVRRNERRHRRLPRSVPQIRGNRAIASGYDGTGWAIAVIDSGVERDHPFFGGRVVAEACFVSSMTCPNGTNRQTGPGSAAPCSVVDECSHGTHVAGIAAGRGDTFTGVAPGASILAVNVESIQTGEECEDEPEDPCTGQNDADIIAALEWVFSQREQFRIASVNLSLGGGRYTSVEECDEEDAATKDAVDLLRSVGILTVAAAGNDGATDALEAPACLSSVVSVGSVTRTDRVADYSSSADFLDLLAPGGVHEDGIESATTEATGREFERQSGTSQATPHVAGAVAVLKQRAPEAAPDVILDALRRGGTPVTDERNDVTKPRIDVWRSLRLPTLSGSRLRPGPLGRRLPVRASGSGQPG